MSRKLCRRVLGNEGTIYVNFFSRLHTIYVPIVSLISSLKSFSRIFKIFGVDILFSIVYTLKNLTDLC